MIKFIVAVLMIVFAILNAVIGYRYSKKRPDFWIPPFNLAVVGVGLTFFFFTVLIKFLYNMGWWPE